MGSALVRESAGSSTGDDDKIYFFFTERSQEQTTTYSHSRVARVARICKVSKCRQNLLNLLHTFITKGLLRGGLMNIFLSLLNQSDLVLPLLSRFFQH